MKDPHSQDLVVVETCWNGLELQFMKVDMPTKKGNLDPSVIVQKNLMWNWHPYLENIADSMPKCDSRGLKSSVKTLKCLRHS